MLPKEYLEKLKAKGLTLGSVESLTGGLFSATVTGIPGASKVYRGTIVAYSEDEKTKLLGIKYGLIAKHGVVSAAVALAMATAGLKILNVAVCVSFTGNAGPDALDGLPVGTVYLGIATSKETKVISLQLKGTRNAIRKQCVQIALDESIKLAEVL
ncbi:MAG: CinA family protein [Firmicutes bacterium]|nr:CinA family protein [Bacillota bacterium]